MECILKYNLVKFNILLNYIHSFFYLALTIMVIYTLVFFYMDTRDYLNTGGTFGEAMTNMPIPRNMK